MAENNEEVSKIWVHEEGSGDVFNPADLRVLAVDANVVCLKYLVAMLLKCQYRVTSTTIATEALKILRENKNDYHIVITDVKRLDMDGFKLLEIIGLEMDLPVIMVSADDSKSSIMKGIRHGARDYLLKPVRIHEIQNIWQHVIRKRLSDSSDRSSRITKEITEQESAVPLQELKADVMDVEEKEIMGNPSGDPFSGKKPRVTWSSELHIKFVDCIQRIEAKGERVHPKRIREMMNEEGLSRENIASHLQKYRNLLKKHKEKISQQENLVVDSNRHRGISFTKNGLWSNASDSTPKSHSPPTASSFIDSKQMFFQPRNHNAFQENSLFGNVVMQERMLNDGEGQSSSTTLTMQNSLPVPEFKGLNFSAASSTWKLPNEYMGSQFFGRDPAPCDMSRFLYSPAASFNPCFPMLGHTSVETSPASVLSCPNPFAGQDEGRISKNLCGTGASNYRERDSHCGYGDQNPLRIDLMNNDEARLYMDEEISEMVKQFNNDAAPRL
ncbi:unnamed protein product [Dovyalis caffra]|uniref:Response regulatory domain-containing protein n=1 Tax=Dovyalis caffra TaxID=77055 RepID=A0AAV1RLM0_9ROSI|nr:unnamed protein product [Dovyalis caffra]